MSEIFSQQNLVLWLPVVLVIVIMLGLKKAGQVSPQEALLLIQQGAVVIDVRSPSEFASDHLDGAVNIPSGQIRQGIAKVVPNLESPILLHCLSGTRSAFALRELKNLGYSNAHNLGSLTRARKILQTAGSGS